MKLKHTPGPWIPERDDNEGIIFILDDEGEDICLITNDESIFSEADEANARLIAAAPEMLDALIRLIKTIRSFQRNIKHDYAIEVIEKATGLKYEEVSND